MTAYETRISDWSADECSSDLPMLRVASVAPYVDAAIAKTVNVPADYPDDAFKNLYLQAWHKGLKGITTYRPNARLAAVLSVPVDAQDSAPEPLTLSEQDKRLVLTEVDM